MERILAERLVETVLRNRFEESQYMAFIDGIFRGFNVETARINNPVDDVSGIWSARFPSILTIRQHGMYTDQNGETLSLLTIYLKHMDLMERARGSVHAFLGWYLNHFDQTIDRGLVASYAGNAEGWHFSLVYKDVPSHHAPGDQRLARKVSSPVHRFSFLAGPTEPCHIAHQQLLPLLTRDTPPSYPDLRKAFNLDTVTEVVFQDYLEILDDLEKEFALQQPSLPASTHRAAALQVLNHLIFTRLVQRKGRLVGNKEYPPTNYAIPDSFLDLVFARLLDRYNFTLSEGSPLDEKMAIDPEMLGKLHESLLTAEERGTRGIYYTPRTEIEYMCRQTLYYYLLNKTTLPPETLLRLLYTAPAELVTCIRDIITDPQRNALVTLIDNISVLDPACGSGSFLIGMLNVLLDLKEKLTSEDLAETRFNLIIRIINHSLHGIDVKDWAVNIASLRLRLKLILEASDDDVNRHASPMFPQLSLKIWQADALLEGFSSHHPGHFDIVIGNPPYIKSQEISPPLAPRSSKDQCDAYKTTLIDHASRLWQGVRIPRSSNYLIYFFYAGLALLQDPGIFTFVTSNSWLDDEYGVPFQEFLLKNMEIREITETREYRIFQQAYVHACISIFSKNQGQAMAKRLQNPVLFLQVLTDITLLHDACLLQQVHAMPEGSRVFTAEDLASEATSCPKSNPPRPPLLNVQKILQASLYLLGIPPHDRPACVSMLEEIPTSDYLGLPWGARFFRTPPELLNLMRARPDVFVPLESIVDIETYLNTGGADNFFFLTMRDRKGALARVSPQGDSSATFEIESEFIVPVFKNPRGLYRIRLDATDTTDYLLVVPKDFLARSRAQDFHVKKLIAWGVAHGYYHASGRKGKHDNWVVLPEQAYANAEVIIPLRMDQNHVAYYNPQRIISHRFYRLRLKPHLVPTIPIPSLIVSLNTLFTYIFLEIYRNPSLGGGVLDLSIPFLRQIQIINPMLLSNVDVEPLLSHERSRGSIVADLGFELTKDHQFRPRPDRASRVRTTFDDAIRDLLHLTAADNARWKELLITMIRNRKNILSIPKKNRGLIRPD